MPRKDPRLGWRPDLPDVRDLMLAAPPPTAPLPIHVDLRLVQPPIRDQGQLGSCTSFACGGCYEAALIAAGLPDVDPSHLFIYYAERQLEGDVDRNAGAQIRDGMKAMNRFGVPPESEWAYDPARFAERPPDQVWQDALDHRATRYQRVPHNARAIKAALAGGHTVAFGFTVYDSFMSDRVAQTGWAPMPTRGEGVQGGHAVRLVGYQDDAESPIGDYYTVANSWGDSWGAAGYFYLPQRYVHSRRLASDFWTVDAAG